MACWRPSWTTLCSTLFAVVFLGFFTRAGFTVRACRRQLCAVHSAEFAPHPPQIAWLISPPSDAADSPLAIKPLWPLGSSVHHVLALSTSATQPPLRAFADLNPALVLWNASAPFALHAPPAAAHFALPLHLASTSTLSLAQPWLPGDVAAGNVSVHASPAQLRQRDALLAALAAGQGVHLHTWAILRGSDGSWPSPLSSRTAVTAVSAPLVTRSPFKPPPRRHRLLAWDSAAPWGVRVQWTPPPPPSWWPAPGTPTTQWLGAADVRLTADATRYPPFLRGVSPFVAAGVAAGLLQEVSGYLPALSANAIRPTQERRRWLLPANASASALPLSVSVSVASPAAHNLLGLMEAGISQQHAALGVGDKDTDDVVRLVVDTPTLLLALTFAVSVLHLCMDVLAFVQDVAFWRTMPPATLARLSPRSLGVDLLCQAVVAAYLAREDASALVLLPIAAGLLVSAWKVAKACRVTGPAPPGAAAVARYDAVASAYMAWLLAPPLAGWAAFSLLCRGACRRPAPRPAPVTRS